MTAAAKDPVMPKKIIQFRDGSFAFMFGRPSPGCQQIDWVAHGKHDIYSPIMRNTGFPSAAAAAFAVVAGLTLAFVAPALAPWGVLDVPVSCDILVACWIEISIRRSTMAPNGRAQVIFNYGNSLGELLGCVSAEPAALALHSR